MINKGKIQKVIKKIMGQKPKKDVITKENLEKAMRSELTENIAVIGLGYVGLPLAVQFSKNPFYDVWGFDVNKKRIQELDDFIDRTNEVSSDELTEAFENGITFVSKDDEEFLVNADIFIITVPTPIDKHKKPDLSYVYNATAIVAKYIKRHSIVIYESTVFPGCTEDHCVPILEHASGLIYGKDFFVGYSPERINPSDKKNKLTNITKVVSASNDLVLEKVNDLYLGAGIPTYKAPSIKVAEMSKAIENAQRDLNISFANEIALICDKLGIDTGDVLKAAGTKWNFLPFKPGLVGGHCISVDPYYLTYKAESLGYIPHVIHSGREVNDNIPKHIANNFIQILRKKDIVLNSSTTILILGVTFKENCPDIRNSKVFDLIKELREFNINVIAHDPHANYDEIYDEERGILMIKTLPNIKSYDGMILAVAHDEYYDVKFNEFLKDNSAIYDLKGTLPRSIVDARL